MLLLTSIGAKVTIFTTTSSPSPRKALGESIERCHWLNFMLRVLDLYSRQCDA
jgi:hypothetical protein